MTEKKDGEVKLVALAVDAACVITCPAVARLERRATSYLASDPDEARANDSAYLM
jgi:hypothetical protein